MARIAVENTLGNVKQHLQNNGFQVVPMDNTSIANCECCVISGEDNNMMGIANTLTKAPVINAQGLTAEEVLEAVNHQIANQ
ncbi:YkuS family protein [Aneurinibacillus tyrosinisolvens]|uniref:YkuS family protein n=1 Tax=Aneurinibacillus tyrosinisolvens TaxID=1443435 RepID=UPI00063FA40F|nr:YkuS family protein [Aneurinibacillus tyrosinisolvens]